MFNSYYKYDKWWHRLIFMRTTYINFYGEYYKVRRGHWHDITRAEYRRGN